MYARGKSQFRQEYYYLDAYIRVDRAIKCTYTYGVAEMELAFFFFVPMELYIASCMHDYRII